MCPLCMGEGVCVRGRVSGNTSREPCYARFTPREAFNLWDEERVIVVEKKEEGDDVFVVVWGPLHCII